jgi:hypothetical protein
MVLALDNCPGFGQFHFAGWGYPARGADFYSIKKGTKRAAPRASRPVAEVKQTSENLKTTAARVCVVQLGGD